MEKELDLILAEFDEGNMCIDTLRGKLLFLFGVVGRSEQLVCDCKPMEYDVDGIRYFKCRTCGKSR